MDEGRWPWARRVPRRGIPRLMGLKSAPRAVVTGAASGLGRGFVEELLSQGARVLASDVDERGLEALASALDAGDRLHLRRADVSRPTEVAQLAEDADALWAGTDLVINNAGVGSAGPIGEVPLEEWDRVMGINFFGVMYGCHAFVPRMRRAGGGWVLNVASAAGLIATPEMGAYNSSKAAVVALSETLRGEISGSGVGVSVLCPFFFKTNILESGRFFGAESAKRARLAERFMNESPLDARGVARFALEGSQRGDFYLIPHRAALSAWRLKRLVPERFDQLSAALRRWVER
jgi:NAD(P)-dependent dehydrogenase (short-subunit alcohol dehydrogenase family)